jgi:hypothetical protein
MAMAKECHGQALMPALRPEPALATDYGRDRAYGDGQWLMVIASATAMDMAMAIAVATAMTAATTMVGWLGRFSSGWAVDDCQPLANHRGQVGASLNRVPATLVPGTPQFSQQV